MNLASVDILEPTYSRYKIEHTFNGEVWVSYMRPLNDIKEAYELFEKSRKDESKKKHPAKLRLVRETRAIIDSD
jgi:hypothetical protein